jgi:hypothetical protein
MRSHASIPFMNSLPDPSMLEEILYDLPPLEGVLLHWHIYGAAALTPGIMSLFSRREQLLGPATLPGDSIKLLATCASESLHRLPRDELSTAWETRPLHARLVRHRPTQSAVETQALLPPGVLVQKTVTLALGESLVLCTGASTQRLSRQERYAIAQALGLPHRTGRRTTINPETCDSVEVFGMLPGMVSPFLRPLRATKLTALVLLPWPRRWEAQAREVAISLSLWESLVLPLGCLRLLLKLYANRAYPAVRLIHLHEREEAGESPGDAGASSPVMPAAPAAPPLAGKEQRGARR